MSVFYTYKAWVDTFKPVANPLRNQKDFLEIGFETYGDEVEHVRLQDPNHVWTEVDGDDGTYIVSGYHYVNRIQYFVTENPWTDDMTEVPAWMQRLCDCQDNLEILDMEDSVYCSECAVDEGYIDIPCETVEDLRAIYGEKANIVG
jgi:hypothetical protein